MLQQNTQRRLIDGAISRYVRDNCFLVAYFCELLHPAVGTNVGRCQTRGFERREKRLGELGAIIRSVFCWRCRSEANGGGEWLRLSALRKLRLDQHRILVFGLSSSLEQQREDKSKQYKCYIYDVQSVFRCSSLGPFDRYEAPEAVICFLVISRFLGRVLPSSLICFLLTN